VVPVFFFSSRRRRTRSYGDWSSDVCSSDLADRPAERFGLDLHRGSCSSQGQKAPVLTIRRRPDWSREVRARESASLASTTSRCEIGRASWREREGIYGVRGASTQKRQTSGV